VPWGQVRPALVTTQFDAHVTPALVTAQDGLPAQINPELLTEQPEPGEDGVVPVAAGVVVVDVVGVVVVAARVVRVDAAVVLVAAGR
jgi:hypothetical protein